MIWIWGVSDLDSPWLETMDHGQPDGPDWLSNEGPAKQKKCDPRGGWVGQSTKKGWVRFFSIFFYRVFKLPSPGNAQKRDKQIEEKIGFGFLVDFFVNTFRHVFFFCKTFLVVFLNSHR
jgi:hypothetical protein